LPTRRAASSTAAASEASAAATFSATSAACALAACRSALLRPFSGFDVTTGADGPNAGYFHQHGLLPWSGSSIADVVSPILTLLGCMVLAPARRIGK
jgi:hypothetical protein